MDRGKMCPPMTSHCMAACSVSEGTDEGPTVYTCGCGTAVAGGDATGVRVCGRYLVTSRIVPFIECSRLTTLSTAAKINATIEEWVTTNPTNTIESAQASMLFDCIARESYIWANCSLLVLILGTQLQTFVDRMAVSQSPTNNNSSVFLAQFKCWF